MVCSTSSVDFLIFGEQYVPQRVFARDFPLVGERNIHAYLTKKWFVITVPCSAVFITKFSPSLQIVITKNTKYSTQLGGCKLRGLGGNIKKITKSSTYHIISIAPLWLYKKVWQTVLTGPVTNMF